MIRAPAGDSIPGVHKMAVAWSYEGAARALILALKLRALRAAAEPCGRAMGAAARRVGLSGEAICWVPARAAIRTNGFDHAALLAELVGHELGLPTAPLLRRIARRPDQTSLDPAARRASPRGAFAARGVVPERILLVDDLVTTGATAAACAAALLEGGARRVELVAACRA